MPLQQVPNGHFLTQTNAYNCGAASAVYLRCLLGNLAVANADNAACDAAFGHTRTTRIAPWLGSTPRGIAQYISGFAIPNLQITRISEAGETQAVLDERHSERNKRPWMIKLRGQIKDHYAEHPFPVYGPRDAILRFLVRSDSYSVSAHFVVQTHFVGAVQIYNPSDGYVSTLHGGWGAPPHEYANGPENWRSVGLDLVFSIP